jgi:hypothetical protein
VSDAGEEGKRDGMDRAKRHADPHWWQCMIESLKHIATTRQEYDVDDVELHCEKYHPNASTHEPRASGPVMRHAAINAWAVPTGMHKKSIQPKRHRRPVERWHSLIYKGPNPRPRPRRKRFADPRQGDLDL